LLNNIKNYLNCGLIEIVKTRPNAAKFVVYNFEDIINKIIPFLDKYALHGVKKLDYYDFRAVAFILLQCKKTKGLTEDAINNIKLIKSKMNKNRN